MATRKSLSPARGVSGDRDAASPTRRAAHTTVQPSGSESLGVRLKHARLVRQLTLKALAEQAGCSESLLSKVEGGHATPSLATLHRIALALSTNIAALLAGPEVNTSPVQRANERPTVVFPSTSKHESIRLERLVVPGPGRLLQGDIYVIEPRASSDEQISHVGEELGYVIEGELELTLGETVYLLQPGDSFHFPSTVPHSYRNPGKAITRVLWVNTPPTF
ncbi:MAG TPA: cupin domain-containing protein [Trinickia sp.]|uniref:cupin domain-containing protein n=1 Tax=Trinickia sp. TaxID=2571163 RepID=UPI002BC81820|nr:cupin domain-containing protein [Trinickia sp.]HTI18269.1 cupin domain-containing protein [Trinickia sp.]